MTDYTPSSAPRRTFLTRLLAASAGLGVSSFGRRLDAQQPTVSDALAETPHRDGTAVEPEPWTLRLRGKHRVIFHSHLAADGLAITWARTFLDTQKSSYEMRDEDSTVIVGLNGRSIGLFFNDAMWSKHPIADTMQMKGTTNPNSAAVAALIGRGAIMLLCNNSLRASGSRFLPEAARADAAARNAFVDEARANLLPGVEIVPAMVVALQRAQDLGCRYIYAGG